MGDEKTGHAVRHRSRAALDGSPARQLYDTWSPTFLECAGATHQTGLLAEAPTPTANNLRLAQWAGMRAGDRVVDLGCGVCGPALDWLTRWPDLHVTGVTFSPVQVELARQRISAVKVEDRCVCLLGDYHHTELPTGCADVVMLLESACYSDDPPKLCREIVRLLRPGGRLLLKDFFLVEGPIDPRAQAEVTAQRALWQHAELRTAAAWRGWLLEAGMATVQVARPAVDLSWYAGTMVDVAEDGLRLNRFGERFFRPIRQAPTEWAVLWGARA